jgi:electron transfer flavoprotein beta subunit
MNIVVLVKQVPDTYSERKLRDADHTLDRDAADAVLDEINERAVEEALLLKEAQGGEITVVSVGPERATEAIRKALSMGADAAVHVTDDALHGADVLQTAKVLARAIGTVEGVDLVLAGNESTDGVAGAVPSIVAELLGLPQLTHARKVEVAGSTVTVERETADEGLTKLEASLPALVSVTEKINEPRYPSFKGIMAAKKKPVRTVTVADLGVDAGEVGLANAWSTVLEAAPKPPRTGGRKAEDEGDGGVKIAEFLVSQKLI